MPGEIAIVPPPPRPSLRGAVTLDQLWSQLTEAQRQRTLTTLSGIVARQLTAPRDKREVASEQL